jgi:hypothetical protein
MHMGGNLALSLMCILTDCLGGLLEGLAVESKLAGLLEEGP